MKVRTFVALAGMVSVVAFVGFSHADQIPAGFSWTQTGGPAVFTEGSSVYLLSIPEITNTAPITLPSGTGTFPISSFFDVFAEISIEPPGGPPVTQTIPDVPVDLNITPLGGGIYDTQITQLDLTVGSTEVRIDPTMPSTGQTTVTNNDGTFRIDSFFDIFTDISLDSGGSWSPVPSNPLVDSGTSTPLPSTAWAGLALLTGLLPYAAVLCRTQQRTRLPN